MKYINYHNKKYIILEEYLKNKKKNVQKNNYWIINDVIINDRFIKYNEKNYIMNINWINELKEYIIPEYNINYLGTKKKKYEEYRNNNKLFLNFCVCSNNCHFHLIFETLNNIFKILSNNTNLNNKNTIILINNENLKNVLIDLFKCTVINIKNSKTKKIYIKNLIIPYINFNYNYELLKEKSIYKKNKNVSYFDINNLILLRKHIFYIYKIKIKKDKNVLIDRNSKLRKIINKKDLDIVINNYDLEIFEPNNFSIVEQIKYFSTVNNLFLQGGSCLINIIFMPENSNVHILYNNSIYVNEYILHFIKDININLIKIKTNPIYKNVKLNNIYLYHADLFINNNNFIDLIKYLNKIFNKNIKYEDLKKNFDDKDKLFLYVHYSEDVKVKDLKIIKYIDLYNLNNYIELNKDYEKYKICNFN